MGTPYGMEPLGFDYDGCEDLALEYEGVATVLERHAEQRPGMAETPRAEWDGNLATEFDGRVELTVADAGEIATALRTAATGLRELAESAQREDDRREHARAWSEQQDRGFWASVGDNISDFFGGEDDIPPPPPPEDPPVTEVLVTLTPDREGG